MKYDVGILTFWNVPNYGTFAQAYALQKAIAAIDEQRDVRQIAYLNKKHYNSYYAKRPPVGGFGRSFYRKLPSYLNKNSPYNLRKKNFLDAYKVIPHTENLSSNDLSNTEFNTVILGSDIVWDYSFDLFDHDSYLFGNNIKATNISAYAASFGTIKRNSKYPQYVIDGIKKMKKISVRDENSADIVEEITGERPTIVLDPTWLWNFNEDKAIPEIDYKDYMIVYGQDFSKRAIDQIIEYAQSHDLKLICLDCNNDNYEWCEILLKQYQLSPLEWIALFKNATTIATTTYHGLTFSLIFKKRFAFFKTNFIMDKAGSFLRELGLYDLFNKEGVTIEEMLGYEWNYEKINSVINMKRKESYDFLKQIIE